MNILKTSRDLSKVDIYLLTKSPTIKTVKDCEGEVVLIDMWCIYEDENRNGNVTTLLSFCTSEGQAYATNSPTFIGAFSDIVDIFGDELPPITLMKGISKKGKEFVTCAYIPIANEL